MDPITLIVTALALGAAAGLKPTAEQAVRDAYTGLKGLIVSHFGSASASIASLEANPASKNRQDAVKEDLENRTAKEVKEVLTKAKELLDMVEQHDPEAAAAIGVNLIHVRAAALRIEDIDAKSTGVQVKHAEFSDSIEIKRIRAGVDQREEDPNL